MKTMRFRTAALVTAFTALAGLVTLAGCEPSAPEEPTWTDDVRPILAANCVRCHGFPAIHDAPSTFRLDVYDDTFTDDNRQIRGAGAMSEFMWLRTAEETMPPEFPLADYQIETLKNWAALRPELTDGYRGRPPEGERAADDADPVMTLLDTTATVADDEIRFSYELRDPDFDLINGTLTAIDAAEVRTDITKELLVGRRAVVWDVRTIAEGSYDLVASIDDGDGPIEVELGSVEVVHGANTAPTAVVLAPARDTIISDLDSPFTVRIRAADLDGDDLELTLVRAVRDDGDPVTIDEDVAVVAGETTEIVWDTADVPAGSSWFIEATVSDGTTTRSTRSNRLVISHGATDEIFGTEDDSCDGAEPPIGCILGTRCGWCHTGPNVPGLFMNLEDYEQEVGVEDSYGAYDVRGAIYRRVFLEETMPPESARLLPPDPLTDDDRARLESWLLGGAPEQ
jgi:hypothetical protein